MKLNLLCILLALLLFAGCMPTSHIAIMPNEPGFEAKKEIKAAWALGFDHLEGQAALSITNHIGLTGGYYWALKGVKMYEVGTNFFVPLNKKKTFFISTSGGFGGGSYIGAYAYAEGLAGAQNIKMGNRFKTYYTQGSIIWKIPGEHINKLIISLKKQWIYFSAFKVDLDVPPHTGNSNVKYYTEANNKEVFILTPYISYYHQKEYSPLFLEMQLGWHLNSKFSSKWKPRGGGGGNGLPDDMHPLIFPFMLNMSVGVRL